MPKFIAILLAALAILGLLAPEPAQARVYIDITKPSSRKIPLAMPEYGLLPAGGAAELGGLGRQVLIGDLTYTGLFDILDPKTYLGTGQGEVNPRQWKRIGADLLITGNYESTPTTLSVEMRLFDVTEGKLLVGRRYDGLPTDMPAIMHRFADEVMEALTGEKSVFSTQIAFTHSVGGIKEIWLMNFDGSGARQLTQRGDICLFPAWSPDGRLLAYSCYVNRRPAVILHALAGGSGQVVINKPGVNLTPTFRPNGQLAAATSHTGKTNIFLSDQVGNLGANLTDGWGIDVAPSFSPDGRQMAFCSDRAGQPQIYIRDMDSGTIRRITYGHKYAAAPAWSPRGDRIAFQVMTNGVFQVATIRPDGSDQQILTHGYGGGEEPTWSPDGRLIAYASRATGRYQIYVMTANGQPIKRLTDLAGENANPAWSPRGVAGVK
ncbi:MAG: Tol-Pal system beta propeller repeat protein TolB [Thermodesulfobacteriota bacterium]